MNPPTHLVEISTPVKSEPIYTPPYYNDLTATLNHAWACLTRGSADRRSPFHAPVVATIGLDGTPQQRTLILRKVDVASRTLRFFTDTRSAKIAEWRQNPRVSVLTYSASDKIQLRLSGSVRCETDSALADNCWANLRETARAGYAQNDAPGVAISTPDADSPVSALINVARDNFCLIHVDVDSLDWVFLSSHGNRRAQFSWPEGVLNTQWLAP